MNSQWTMARSDGCADADVFQRFDRRHLIQPLLQLLRIVAGPDRCAHRGGHVPEPPFQLAKQNLAPILQCPFFFQFVGHRSSHLENLLAMYVRLDRGFDSLLQLLSNRSPRSTAMRSINVRPPNQRLYPP